MQSSPLYVLALLIVCTDRCWRIRLCSVFCIMHIFAENLIAYYFKSNIIYFDLGLYLNLLWALDLSLIVSCLLVLSGIRKKMIVAGCSAVVISQMIFLQYPYINEYISAVLIEQSYFLFMETFILLSSIKTDCITNIIKLSSIIFLIVIVHLLY